MLVLAHMQVFCICIFLPMLPLPCRRFEWEALEHLSVPFNSTPLIIFPLFHSSTLIIWTHLKKRMVTTKKVNIQRKQNCWVRQLRSSRTVIIPKKPSLSPVVSSAGVSTMNGGLSHPHCHLRQQLFHEQP